MNMNQTRKERLRRQWNRKL